MLQYGVRKLAHTLLVALGVVTLVFAALRLSGDPAATMLPGDASVDELVALRKTLGLDRPIPVQYVSFLAGAVTGDFGISFRHQQPALGLVIDRLPATLELAFAALVLAVVVAVPLGIIAALNRGRLADVLAMAFAVVGQATPYFWMGIMLILVVSVELGWLPTSGPGSSSWRSRSWASTCSSICSTASSIPASAPRTRREATALASAAPGAARDRRRRRCVAGALGGAGLADVRQPGGAAQAAGVDLGRQRHASSRHRSARAGPAF